MTAHSCFELIQDTKQQSGNMATISELCQLAGVSRSGYYAWLANENRRQARETADYRDYQIVSEAFNYKGFKKGARSIYMRLLHMKPPVVMNLKKIRRIMKKYGLKCPIRKHNPARQMAKALQTSHVAPNLVNRQFNSFPPRKCLLTDISYLQFHGEWCYLSTIYDVCTHEILSYQISTTLEVTFVLHTVEQLIQKYGAQLDDQFIVHSDQGCHYTSKAFIQMLKENNIIQSMSRKGNCWDNAPQESFFGHMKDDLKREIRTCTSFKQVEQLMEIWMDYYNNERYQWELEKLSPHEYYEFRKTGIYPLTVTCGVSKNYRGFALAPKV